MILGSFELRKLLKERQVAENTYGDIRWRTLPPILEPYCGKKIEGSGLEVRVDKLFSFFDGGRLGVKTKRTPDLNHIKPDSSNEWRLRPHEAYHILTVEKINMPNDLTGIITPRSTLQRCGVGLLVANIAPGYRGELSFGIVNHTTCPFILKKDARIAFIQFAELKEQEVECCYEGNYQGGKCGTDGRTVEHINGVHNSVL